MLINTDRAICPNCGTKLEKTSQMVVDETSDDLVLFCMGFCGCTNSWYEWYEHYGYKGHMEVGKSGAICAREV